MSRRICAGDEFVLVETDERFKTINVPLGGLLQVTEIVPEDWALVGVDCGNCLSQDIIFLENGFLLNNCDGGEIVCEFQNRLLLRPVPALSQWGLIAAAVAIGIVGIVFYSRRKATS